MPVAVVTGSESGIGKSSAVALAKAGFDIGITSFRDEEGASDTARQVEKAGRRASVRRLYLRQPTDVPGVIEELASNLGGLDVFVNNAATAQWIPFLELDLPEWQQVLEVNLTGAFVAAQAAALRMIEESTKGRIINITSVHEHIPLSGGAAYCAAKAGLGLLTKVMALELAEHGITVNSVAPGEIATAMTNAEDVDPFTLRRPGIPLGRPGHAEEVAAAVVFLAQPETRYATGTSIVIDGGLTLSAAQAND